MSHDDDDREQPRPYLELAKTRLSVEDGELLRRDDKGGIAMRIPLDDIESVRFSRPISFSPILPWFLAACLIALGRYFSESNTLSVLLYTFGAFAVFVGLVTIRKDTIFIRTRGEEMAIDCVEVADECQGFVASLRSMCGSNREEIP
jgi:hypothetical protein